MQSIELGTESIPGCVLQIYVLLTTSEKLGTGALMSIASSALTTGFTSALISFDTDVDVKRRQVRPKVYGIIPDDYAQRGTCFILMMLISTLHNLSRSIGCAVLAASSGKMTLTYFVCGEMLVYLAYKVFRRDFMCWVRVDGILGVIMSIIIRIISKLIVDFSGCLHFRHPFELGGAAFTLSTLFAHVMPFFALWLYKEQDDHDVPNEEIEVTTTNSTQPNNDTSNEIDVSSILFYLMCSFALWLLLNIAFFCSIDLSYVHSFFGIETGE